MYKVEERIKALEYEVSVLGAILKARPDRRLRDKYKSAKQALDLNVSIYSQITGVPYRPNILASLKGVEKEWKVSKGPQFKSGVASRELYLNGYLYKNMITLEEAKTIMEELA